MLARREYSYRELHTRLAQRGCPSGLLHTVLQHLVRTGVQSDARCAEAMVHAGLAKGQGPLKILRDMEARGIADDLATMHLSSGAPDWLAHAERTRARHYGTRLPKTPREQAKQARFLYARGFTVEQIHTLLGMDEDIP